jgi:EAL domain-containing protein (putative c-di-GMP-specific phosphodiesterase class I)
MTPDVTATPAGVPSQGGLLGALDRTRRTRALVEELIADPAQLGPDFQPIRRLADDTVVAWKATGRGRRGTELADTLALLEQAVSLGLVERLDWAFRALVFDQVLQAGLQEPIHLTPEPETYLRACPPRLAVAIGRGLRELAVVAEVHADALRNLDRLDRAVAEMRGWGWSVVLADVSGEPDGPAALERIRPELVQVDLGRPGPTSSAAPSAFLARARELGAEVMALGVDTPNRRNEAVALGATLGRGLLLGPPGPLPVPAQPPGRASAPLRRSFPPR